MSIGRFIFLLALIFPFGMFAQKSEPISDESKVPAYELPEVLKTFSGRTVKNVKTWEKKRRPEILSVFENQVYGKVPGELKISDVEMLEQDSDAFGGLAIRKQLALVFRNNGKTLRAEVLMYLPKSDSKVPVFLSYNFLGNHTVCDDPHIRLTESWVPDQPAYGIINNQVTEQSRGVDSNRWPIERILKAGYGIVTMYYGDIDPDKNDFSDGIHPFFYTGNQQKPRLNEWGSLSAWGWGLSRILDYLETDPQVDAHRVAVMGFSRLGKAAVWAGAQDVRFAMVISNESGCGGAALSRRKFGETLAVINKNFPHWFCDNFKFYSDMESALPVDQHMLLALVAPRPLYVASAEDDWWSDPKGEFLAAKFASPVYNLMGLPGLPATDMPAVNEPVMGTIAYHIRSGKHDVTDFDWDQYLKFADMYLKR